MTSSTDTGFPNNGSRPSSRRGTFITRRTKSRARKVCVVVDVVSCGVVVAVVAAISTIVMRDGLGATILGRCLFGWRCWYSCLRRPPCFGHHNDVDLVSKSDKPLTLPRSLNIPTSNRFIWIHTNTPCGGADPQALTQSERRNGASAVNTSRTLGRGAS